MMSIFHAKKPAGALKRRLPQTRFILRFGGVLFCALSSLLPSHIFGQEAAQLDAISLDSASVVEKSDWARYDDGKYVGHVYREVRSSIVPLEEPQVDGFQAYRGNFFVLEETLRDMRSAARAVNDVVPVRFNLSKNGTMTIEQDRGFPSLRNFPSYSKNTVYPGDKWTAAGKRALDPLNNGAIVLTPFLAEYEYKGVEIYKDIPVHRITARYASRYNSGRMAPIAYDGAFPKAQPFTGLNGKHEVDILIRVSNGMMLLSRDSMDETFAWADGKTVRFKGFTLIFGEGLQPLNREALVNDITPQITDADVQVAKVMEGVRLTIQDLQFKPDSDELLPGEVQRLEVIADSLKKIPDRTFLVEGHTAAAGSSETDVELSVARAKRIASELSVRGINASRFIYKGWGSSRPVADNSTEDGRKKNRRVEITIIE
ncbi:MAG: OmpA family protein [Spirochaetaceae bacterium]|jgi:outer membrane protein OmpA-like peptidoglycan-associated protein|nr:OmpA family protein [Spirochaetaceae bacterium]